MRPGTMDAVFRALAHPDRRRILDLVRAMPGCSVADVAKYFPVSRIAVLKQVAVLEEAGLLLSEKAGRARSLHFNAAPIQMIYDRWTTEFSALWAAHATRIKYRVESRGRGHGR